MPPQRPAEESETSRTRKTKLQDPKEDQDDNRCLLPSVTVVLVQNGWLGAKEIGRLLLTSRGAKWGDGEIWTALCYGSWPNSSQIPPGFVRALGGYRALFWHRSTLLLPVNKPIRSPLPTPRLKPNRFGILIDILIGGESAYSGLLDGTKLVKSLLKNGSASYQLEKPFVLGNATCWVSDLLALPFGSECTCERRCRFSDREIDNYEARIHLLRATDKTSCCVFATTGRARWNDRNMFDPIGMERNEFGYFDHDKAVLFDWKNARTYWVLLSPAKKGLSFRQTATAAEIDNRLRQPVKFGLDIAVSLIEPGDKIAMTGFAVQALVGGKVFDEEMSKESGVTMLHILDQLQGVEFDPFMSFTDESDENSASGRSLDSDEESDE